MQPKPKLWSIQRIKPTRTELQKQWFNKYLFLLEKTSWWYNPKSTQNIFLWRLVRKSTTRSLGWSVMGLQDRYRSPSLEHSKLLYDERTYVERCTRLERRYRDKMFPLFKAYWFTTRPKSTFVYTTNRDFRLHFVVASADAETHNLISITRYYARWLDSYNLLLNLFFADSAVQLLSNKLFIEEALIFNWQYSVKNYKLFKYVQPYFTFSDLTHGEIIHDSIYEFFVQTLDFGLVVDVKNHETMLKYLRRYSLYMVGLVPINYSPWIMSYPIPAFSDSALTQYYFLKLVLHIQARADLHKFSSAQQLIL